MNLNGKGSWFGGPGDPTDSGHTALGGTTKEPGIAVYNHGTLGGYWRVTAPNGKTAVVKQTDIGPAPWTGRKIDVTYSALNKFGYGEHNFPTDSEFKATYLGKNAPREESVLPPPPQPATPGIPGTPSKQVEGFDQAGFQKAQRASVLGKLISSSGEAKDNPLFATGLVSTKAPNRAEFQTSTTVPGKPAVPGVPAAPQAASTGGKLGGFLPGNAELKLNRIDAGQDLKTNAGGPIVAPGDGIVVAVKSDPSGFGPDYPVVKFTSGPMAGTSWYLGHTHSALKPGEHFKAGQTLSHTGTHGVGNATEPGWAELGLAGALGQGNQGQGKATERYLKR
jgi:hypothetical protein